MNAILRLLTLTLVLLAVFGLPSVMAEPKCYTDRGAEVCFPLGEPSFADVMVHMNFGDPAPVSQIDRDPRTALGEPDYNSSITDEHSQNERKSVSLGCGGSLTVQFRDNELVDVPGPDLYVFEVGNNIEPIVVSISIDGENWIDVGTLKGGLASADISEFAEASRAYQFVRVEDKRSQCSGEWPGADIDAVGAIGSVPAPVDIASLEMVDTDKLEPITRIAPGESFRIRLTYAEEPGWETSETASIQTSDGSEREVLLSGNSRVILSDPITTVVSDPEGNQIATNIGTTLRTEVRGTFARLRVAAAGDENTRTLDVSFPGKGTADPSISLYSVSDEDGVPVARIERSGQVELPEGSYKIGLGDYPGRLGHIDLSASDAAQISFGRMSLIAPNGATGRYAVMSAESGALVAPVQVSQNLVLPAGRYLLRRDLSSESSYLEIEPGKVLDVVFGGLNLDFGSDWKPDAVYVVAAESDAVVAVATDLSTPVALRPGMYRVAAAREVLPSSVEIAAGKVTDVAAYTLQLSGRAQDGHDFRIEYEAGDIVYNWRANEAVVVPLVPRERSLSVRRDGQIIGRIALGDRRTVSLWRLPSGVAPEFEGLPIALVEGQDAIAVPGAQMQLVFTLPEAATVLFLAHQEGQPAVKLGTRHVAATASGANILVPNSLNTDIPVSFEVRIDREDGIRVAGRTGLIPVHKRIAASVTGVSATGETPTTITLTWTPPSPATGVVGFNIYRGDASFPVNGRLPVNKSEYTDIGLSAGRKLIYRICPVDRLRLEGPCVEKSTSTATGP